MHISTASIIKTIVIILSFALIFVMKDMILVLLTSIVIASAIEPITQWFVRRKVPRTLSVILVYLVFFIFLFGIIYALLVPLLQESGDFLKNFSSRFNPSNLTTTIVESDLFASSGIVTGLTNSFDLEGIIGQINAVVVGLSSNAFGTITTVFGGIMSFVLIIVLSFYLSVERDGVSKFLRIITPVKHEKYITALWERSQRKIGLWMQGQLILAIIVGTLVYLGLLILQVPNALLLAFLAAILEIIPLFGPILAAIPAIVSAFSVGSFTLVLLVIGLYLIIQQFENQLIYPLVVKKVVGLSPVVSIVAGFYLLVQQFESHLIYPLVVRKVVGVPPILVILALIIGAQLGGFLGFVLSVPIAAAVIEFVDDIERKKIREIEAGNE